MPHHWDNSISSRARYGRFATSPQMRAFPPDIVRLIYSAFFEGRQCAENLFPAKPLPLRVHRRAPTACNPAAPSLHRPPCGPPRSAECGMDESLYIAYFRSYEYGTLVSRDFHVAWSLHCCRRNVRPIAAGRFVPSQSAAIRVTFPFPAILPPLLLPRARCLAATHPRQVPLQAARSACDRAPGDLSQPSLSTRKLP